MTCQVSQLPFRADSDSSDLYRVLSQRRRWDGGSRRAHPYSRPSGIAPTNIQPKHGVNPAASESKQNTLATDQGLGPAKAGLESSPDRFGYYPLPGSPPFEDPSQKNDREDSPLIPPLKHSPRQQKEPTKSMALEGSWTPSMSRYRIQDGSESSSCKSDAPQKASPRRLQLIHVEQQPDLVMVFTDSGVHLFFCTTT